MSSQVSQSHTTATMAMARIADSEYLRFEARGSGTLLRCSSSGMVDATPEDMTRG
jgi:hypothetical protein